MAMRKGKQLAANPSVRRTILDAAVADMKGGNSSVGVRLAAYVAPSLPVAPRVARARCARMCLCRAPTFSARGFTAGNAMCVTPPPTPKGEQFSGAALNVWARSLLEVRR